MNTEELFIKHSKDKLQGDCLTLIDFEDAIREHDNEIKSMIDDMIKDDVINYWRGCAINRLTELKAKITQNT